MNLLRKLLADTAGTSSIEYAFISAVIAIGSLVGIQALGASVGTSYNNTATAVRDATP